MRENQLVILESPFAGDVEGNIHYARKAVRDSLLRGEAPIASHLLYTQEGILNDDIPDERQHGIEAGLAWGNVAEKTVVYIDKGISRGMEYGIQRAKKEGRALEFRSLPEFAGELTVQYCEKKYLSNIKIISKEKKEIIQVLHNNKEDMLENIKLLREEGWSDNIRGSIREEIRENEIENFKKEHPGVEIQYPTKGSFSMFPYVLITNHEREVKEISLV